MLLAATAARAFDFKLAAPTGQQVYYTVVAGTTTVKVVNPDWDIYTPPTGVLELPPSVSYNGTDYAVKSIDVEAFAYCTGLTAIVIPEGVTTLGRMAFFSCTALDSIVLPSTLEVIGTQAFNTTAYLSDNSHWSEEGMLMIGTYLIKTRTYITDSLRVPEGITGLGNMAVYNCGELTNITLPSTLRFIGENALAQCNALDTVTVLATVPPTLDVNSFHNSGDFTVFVPCHSGAAYRAAANWSALSIEEMCSPEDTVGIDTAEEAVLTVTTVAGGLVVKNQGQEPCSVSDLLGRRIAQCREGFVALPHPGVYVVTLPGRKGIKVLYQR